VLVFWDFKYVHVVWEERKESSKGGKKKVKVYGGETKEEAKRP